MKNTYLTAISILFLLNIFLTYKVYNLKTQNSRHQVFNTTSNEKLKKKSNEIIDLNESILGNLSINNNKLITDNIILTNNEGEAKTLANLTNSNGKILLYRIPNKLCDPCVNRVISEIKKIKIFNNRLALIISDSSIFEKKDFELTNIGIETYLLEQDLPLDIEKLNKAYFFTVDFNGYTGDGYMPLESNAAFVENYINKILN